MVVPAGVEPASPGPKPEMMDHYTTELTGWAKSHLVLTLTLNLLLINMESLFRAIQGLRFNRGCMRPQFKSSCALPLILILMLHPLTFMLSNELENFVDVAENEEPNIELSNSFLSPQPTIHPPSSDWWVRGEEIVSIYVITRDIESLNYWQIDNGFIKEQKSAILGQHFVNDGIILDGVQHRKLHLPANIVPKLLGVNGVMTIFEDPGAPTPFVSDSNQPLSVRSGELHGSTDAWANGVNGTGVKVAIVDSGLDFAHPDLNGTQARVDDLNNSYHGWPIMWDPRSVDIWLRDGNAYPSNGGSWYSDTSNIDIDNNSDNILDNSGFNVSGINPSLSGNYHHGLHPDSQLKAKLGGEVDVLVVDDFTSGIYETVYVDLDRDGDFGEEIPMRKGNETAGLDTNNDGLWDLSAGLLYWVSDGVNGVPYASTYSQRAGFQNRIAAPGNLTLFMINDKNDAGGNHGTLCASAVAAQAIVNNGKVKGMAPNSELISVANFYGGGSFLDAWRFLSEGYDGQTGSGDEAQIGSFSFGWSSVHNDGTDQMSLYVDWLTRVHSPSTTFLVAMGNGGHGYGTGASPGGSHGVISVGAFSSQTGQSHGGTWGDSASWSNRGPNSASRLDPDIVAVGWSATGDVSLNGVDNANSATTTWAGTSLATPVAAGLVALIYDAWMQEYGVWPDSQTVRNLIMSTSDDRGYDPLVQGGGWANISRAISTIQGHNGSVWVEPAYWMAGTNHGVHREANTNIMLPGDISWANFTINGTGSSAVNISWGGAILSPTSFHSQIWNSSTNSGWDGYQSDRPDILIPIYIKNDANYSLPNGTSLIRARAAMAGSGFDADKNLAQENEVYVELMRWHDDDGDGKWWDDSNNNSLVDSGEMEAGSEYSMVTKHSYTSGQVEARLGLPDQRDGDGILMGVYRKNIRTNLMDPIPIEIDWTGFGPDPNSSWLSPCSGNSTIPANSSIYVNCRVSVPIDAIPGLRQEQIRFEFESNNSSHEWALPVIVNVASDGPVNLQPKPLDGNLTNQSLYSETWLQGAQRWGWRSESGDWKFLTFDWPYNLSGDGAIIVDVDWPDNNLTDVDVHWMSESGHPYYLDDPVSYGQYNLVPEISSTNMDSGSGKYGWETSTGGSNEVLVAEATPGIKQMMLHSAMHGVNTNDNPLNISVGLVNAINGSLQQNIFDWENAEGSDIVTIGATLPLNVSSVEGFGWTQPLLLPSQTATQDVPGTWSSSNYSHQIDVKDALLLRVQINSNSPRTDLDLALYRDKNGNGVIDWGNEQIVTSGNWNSDENVLIESPEDGTWWAVVHGFDVPNGTASFSLTQTIVAGDSLSVEGVRELNNSEIMNRHPNGTAALGGKIPLSAYDVNISFLKPENPGIWRGYLVVNLASGGSIRLNYDYNLNDFPPKIEFITPTNLTRTNQSIQVLLEANDLDNGFNLSSLRLDSNPGLNFSNINFTVEGLSSSDFGSSDYTNSWLHWNSASNITSGSHYVVENGSLIIGTENTTSELTKVDSTAPEWILGHSNQTGISDYITTESDIGWESSNFSDGPRMDYSIEFKSAGIYYLWLRINASDLDGNSVHLGLNGNSISGMGGVQTSTYGNWEWTNMAWDGSSSNQVQFEINNSGRNTLNLWAGKDGVSIDQIIITDSWSFTPNSIVNSSSIIVDSKLRTAWLNMTLPSVNGWTNYHAEITDLGNRVNQTNLMVEYDDISPPIIIYGWDYLSNISVMPVVIQTDPNSELWLDEQLLPINNSGVAEIQLLLQPTYWSNVNGDPNNHSSWEWVDINTFEILARDTAGNWNYKEFDVVYDPWGASNDGVDPQIVLRNYSGFNGITEWSIEGLSPPDSLNAQMPIGIGLDVIYDTKQVCAYMIDDDGNDWLNSCTVQQSPPWLSNISNYQRVGPPPAPNDILIPIYLEFSNEIPDGDWQLMIETMDWAGNWGWENYSLLLDRTPPEINWIYPSQNETLWDHNLLISWNTSEISSQSLYIDGNLVNDFPPGDFEFETSISLDYTGWHYLCVISTDLSLGPNPNIGSNCVDVYLNPEAYVPSLTADWNNGSVNTSIVYANLHIGPSQSWSSQIWDGNNWVIQNGSELSSGDLVVPIFLEEGNNTIKFEVEALEKMFIFELYVVLDSRIPKLSINSPENWLSTSAWEWNLTGSCEMGLDVTVELSSGYFEQLICDANGQYNAKILFTNHEGEEEIKVSSIDYVGNLATISHYLNIDRQAPRVNLNWVNISCENTPVSTIFNPNPIASCNLGVRADFLDSDVSYWYLNIEKDGVSIITETGNNIVDGSLIFDLDGASPGFWVAEIIVEDAAGNRMTVIIDESIISKENSFSYKATTIGSLANILLMIVFMGMLLFAYRVNKNKVVSKDSQLPTPLDPELFVDEYEEVSGRGFDDISMPPSHGPIGSPPVSEEEVAIADASLLQKMRNIEDDI